MRFRITKAGFEILQKKKNSAKSILDHKISGKLD